MRLPYTAALFAILAATAISAGGWNDYRLDIGGGFAVYRMNSFEVCLGGSDGSLLICPTDFPGVLGPLREYAVADAAVATRHSGVRPLPENPSLPGADDAQEWFFLVSRASRKIMGPMSRADFAQHPLRPKSLTWCEPRNPNFWRPVLGTLYSLCLSAIILKWPLVVPVVLTAGCVVFWRVRRRTA
jgi:hypothetical protein